MTRLTRALHELCVECSIPTDKMPRIYTSQKCAAAIIKRCIQESGGATPRCATLRGAISDLMKHCSLPVPSAVRNDTELAITCINNVLGKATNSLRARSVRVTGDPVVPEPKIPAPKIPAPETSAAPKTSFKTVTTAVKKE